MQTYFGISSTPENGDEIRKSVGNLLSNIITSILYDCDYILVRVDMAPVPKKYEPLIFRKKIRAPLPFDDLTIILPDVHHNLSIRHDRKKLNTHLTKESQVSPFDIQNNHAISHSLHFESVKKVKTKVREQENTLKLGCLSMRKQQRRWRDGSDLSALNLYQEGMERKREQPMKRKGKK